MAAELLSAMAAPSFFGSKVTHSMASLSLSSLPSVASPSRSPIQPLQIVAIKKIQGTVIGNGRDKTAAVEVKRFSVHPIYKKRMVRTKKYHVHDPENKCEVGDWVTLQKCAPKSKTKNFVVVEIRPPTVAGSFRHSGDTDSEAEDESSEVGLPPLESEAVAV